MRIQRPWWFFALMAGGSLAAAEPLFVDDFEQPPAGWLFERPESIRVIETGDPAHGKALELLAQGDDVLALIRGSEEWGPIRVEADLLFPTNGHAYLGLVYNLTRTAERTDFGNIYLKGNGSYLRANPLRDGNVSRLLYEEYRTPLLGEGESCSSALGRERSLTLKSGRVPVLPTKQPYNRCDFWRRLWQQSAMNGDCLIRSSIA